MNREKLWEYTKNVFQYLIMFLCVLAALSIAYWSGPYLRKSFGWQLEGYWAFLMDGITASILLGLVIALLVPYAKKKLLGFNQKIIDALKRIAKGDYNVSIKGSKDFESEFGTIIESIHDMADELGQMEKMRQEFISNVSHEIQSPLTSIRGFAQVLQNEELSVNERKHYLQIIETETSRLSNLSDNLLRLTSLEADHQVIKLVSYRLDQQLRNAVLVSEPQWFAKQLEMEMDLDKTEIEADEELMSQVWMNLIHNAIKFTPDHGSIRIEMKKLHSAIEVRISDTGAGIAAEHIPHIFERFFKGDASRNRSAGGNGLGLSIVHKIISLHQGTIGVTSQLGAGTTFRIELPSRHAQAK